VAAVGQGKVEGGHVSPGLGDDEAEFGGAGHKTQLRPLAPRPWGGGCTSRGFSFCECLEGLKLDNKKRGLGGPRGLFCLCFYFIKLQGVNRTFLEIYIWFGECELEEIGTFWGLDKNLGFWVFRAFSLVELRSMGRPKAAVPTCSSTTCSSLHASDNVSDLEQTSVFIRATVV
jgi:hypothetical protein